MILQFGSNIYTYIAKQASRYCIPNFSCLFIADLKVQKYMFKYNI